MTRTEEHTTSEGAPAAATRWLRTLDAGDYVEAWKQLTPCLRLAWAQVWLWRNRHAAELDGHDLDEMAAAFAAPDPRHVRWPGFALGELGSLHDSLPRPAADYTDTKALALAMVVGVDLERVVIAPHGAALFPSRGEPVVAVTLTMQLQPDGAWLVASHSAAGTMPQPGWPPVL